ncbi:MAG: hypothetical protein H6741_29450 [Alphaproteobacteria bacterium]|nr:hypothetical protein [Alphaproteobacteria bacterium]
MESTPEPPADPRARARVAVGVLALLAVFALGLWQWSFTCDDAWISFRYARNLVEGHGLVWNPGERVEGYTNFLWVLLTAGGMALGFAPEVVTQVMGTLAGLGVLALVTVFSGRRWGWGTPLAWLPPALLVTNRSFVAWSSGGLATQLFTLFVLGGALTWLSERRREVRDPLLSSTLLALATLTRPEGGLFTAILGLFFLYDVMKKQARLDTLVRWCMPWFLIVGVHFAWRYSYYGQWWPNTFYAKVEGVHVLRGLEYIGAFAWIHTYYATAALAFVGMAQGLKHARVLMGMALGYLAYLCVVGGDHIAYRFMVPLLPMGALLAAEGLSAIVSRGRPRLAWGLGLAALLCTGLAAYSPHSWNIIYYIKPVVTLHHYSSYRGKEGRFLRKLVDEGRLPEDIVVAAGGIGALGYESRLEVLDMRGLTDAMVTQKEMKAKVPWVGHELLATQAYLDYRGADIIDVLNRLIHVPEQSGQRSKQAITRVAKRWRGHPGSMPVLCLATEEGAMIFATKATEERQAQLFGGFELCRDVYGETEGEIVPDVLAEEPGGE